MIDETLWTPEELAIFALFHGLCAVCKIAEAVTLHEIFPKSKRPNDWQEPTNRLPVCNLCHRRIHDHGINKEVRDNLTAIRMSVENA